MVGVPFREIVGSQMCIANKTRPDIGNAVRAIARFSQDPEPINCKAGQKIIEYLNATAGSGLTLRKHDLGYVHFEFDLETYVRVDYVHKAEDRRFVYGDTVCCGGYCSGSDVEDSEVPYFYLPLRQNA